QNSSAYGKNTLQGKFGWSGTLNGKGINIAILDQCIDATYPAKYGYDAINDVETDPAPNSGDWHGTNMAGFALGPGGMAPQAGLIDMKVGTLASTVGQAKGYIQKALEKIYEKHKDWGINVVNMSLSTAISDGKDTLSQLANLLSSQGIVVVGSAGPNSPGSFVEAPAAASLAIAVSAADLNCTVDRKDDTAPFVKGPRSDYTPGKTLTLGQHKPDLIIPTGTTKNCPGPGAYNSPASALMAGLAALILQQNAELRDFNNKASGSVKDLLVRSAESKGQPYSGAMSYPNSTPTWTQYWGFGEIDAFNAFQHLTGKDKTQRTDFTFKGFDNTTHPSSPWYFSKSVETLSERNGKNIRANVPDKIFARIYNKGPENVQNVKVNFSFYPFAAGIFRFHDIGSVLVDIAKNKEKEVSIDWTPPAMSAGQEHGCIQVTIDYGYDSNFSNMSNFAQKNVQVKQTTSPATFFFRVENPLPGDALIDLKVTTDDTNWSIKLSESSFMLSGYDCAKTIQATVEPPAGIAKGTEALVFVTAYATEMGKEQAVDIGGVALKARFEGKVVPPWFWWFIVFLVFAAFLVFLYMFWRRKKRMAV
ncbi:MAG: S8 family serine peptidase, partial [Planctomycetota bacterium]